MMLEEPVFIALFNYTKALSVALGYRDLMTRLHSDRVHGLSTEIAIACGLTSAELDVLKLAASFHDIGKIGTPDHILLKPASLDEPEWTIMKQHSEIGEKIIAATELEGSQRAALLIRHHHEHHSGQGYPDKLAGQDIPVGSRIISIADSYDAMAVTRSYHRAQTHQDIMDILHEETGEKHDPEIMSVFCKIIESSSFKAVKI